MASVCRYRRRNTIKGCFGLIIFAFLVYAGNKLYHLKLHKIWLSNRQKLQMQYEDFLSQRTVTLKHKNLRAQCELPQLNAFAQDTLQYMEHAEKTCPLTRYGKIKDGMFVVKGERISDVTIRYVRRAIKKNEINKDNHVTLSEKIYLKLNDYGYYQIRLEEDIIKAEMYVNGRYHLEFHAHFPRNTEGRRSRKKMKAKKPRQSYLRQGIPLNVIMVMVDSQSHANFERQMIKTIPTLKSDEDTIILQGHTIVADGTTGQLTAAFTGTHEKDLPESRRGFPGSSSCDRYPWIFRKFNESGYSTLFTETDPKYAAFNYRLYGFKTPPTTHYMRAYWLGQYELDDYHYCNVQYNLHLLREFTETYEDEPKFAYCAMGRIAHNDMNLLQVMDDDILEMIRFYKHPKRVENTMFILFSDHGARTHSKEFRTSYQGKLEERLPFISFTVPPSFKKKYPEYFSALKENSEVLTSHYDLYATFDHILSHPEVPEQSKYIGRSLFTKIDPQTRTCANAGVLDHWCPCLDYTEVSKTSAEVIKVVQAMVNSVNKLVKNIGPKSELCAELKLDTIITASVLTPKTSVQTFKDTKRDGVCDSCGIVSEAQSDTRKMMVYEIKFMVKPSGGAFEMNAKIINGEIIIDPNISRMNEYGDHPRCVMDEFPHLRQFCYCLK